VFDTSRAVSSPACWVSTAISCEEAALCVRVASRRTTGSLEGSIVVVIEEAGIVSATKRLVASALGRLVYGKVSFPVIWMYVVDQ
jgi:hypothetical protein